MTLLYCRRTKFGLSRDAKGDAPRVLESNDVCSKRSLLLVSQFASVVVPYRRTSKNV